MERVFEVENHKIGVKCSAGTVRTYRNIHGRDLIKDMVDLEKELVETKTLGSETAEIAENVIYIMAKEYDDWEDRVIKSRVKVPDVVYIKKPFFKDAVIIASVNYDFCFGNITPVCYNSVGKTFFH